MQRLDRRTKDDQHDGEASYGSHGLPPTVTAPTSADETLEILKRLAASKPSVGAAAAAEAAAAFSSDQAGFSPDQLKRLERLEALLQAPAPGEGAAAAVSAVTEGEGAVAPEVLKEVRRLVEEGPGQARPEDLEDAPWPVVLSSDALAAWAGLPGRELRKVVLHALISLASGRCAGRGGARLVAAV